ncbi:hypothetical protein BDV93DRAFT_205085 [Ceratobasidium sp. AG-I]|nr:hypothetical protein BDV93DRAFT_205085 [Ceratobasidium sp. AG-I]
MWSSGHTGATMGVEVSAGLAPRNGRLGTGASVQESGTSMKSRARDGDEDGSKPDTTALFGSSIQLQQMTRTTLPGPRLVWGWLSGIDAGRGIDRGRRGAPIKRSSGSALPGWRDQRRRWPVSPWRGKNEARDAGCHAGRSGRRSRGDVTRVGHGGWDGTDAHDVPKGVQRRGAGAGGGWAERKCADWVQV